MPRPAQGEHTVGCTAAAPPPPARAAEPRGTQFTCFTDTKYEY